MKKIAAAFLSILFLTATAYSEEIVVTSSRIDINKDGKQEVVSLVMTNGRKVTV